MNTSAYSIGQVAARTGLTVHQIRNYANLGLVHCRQAVLGGRRLFDEGCVQQLVAIASAMSLGFTISEIRAYFLAAVAQDACRTALQGVVLLKRVAAKRAALARLQRHLESDHRANAHEAVR